MELENVSPEAFPDLGDILFASGTTLNVSGGIGGQGGRGGQEGGAGGNGEGPILNVSGAAGWIVHVNDRGALTNSETLGSAFNPAPPEFSICDINLQQEVYLDDSRVRLRRRKVVKKYYSAEVKDRKEMTVVFYEGKNAKEEFKEDVAKYMKFRHPSFLQLYGTVCSGNNYASIFYDVLIPWRDIERIYRLFPVVFCYIYASVSNEFEAASGYFQARFGSVLRSNQSHYTLFLRPSTGQLCIDLEGHDSSPFVVIEAENISPMSLLSTIDTQTILDALTIEQYHMICNLYCWNHTYTQFSLTATAHLGAVYHTTGHHNLGNPVAAPRTLDIGDCLSPAWYLYQVDPHITESGWNRFAVSELIGRELGEEIELHLLAALRNSDLWFSQANHVLNWLGVSSNAYNYAVLDCVYFRVELKSQPARPTDWHSSNGFLFLSPPQSFQVGPVSFKCPECVGYWSLDPSGMDCLSEDEASELGFPAITVSIMGRGEARSATVYAGLRQFHQGKGFDPNSQDVARHLGVPLYQPYSDYDNSMDVDDGDFGAHIEEVSSTDWDTDQPMDVD
ncbi:hypothetical protein R3P38DRAFT_601760 [Favolaschia claudopus]|uniref:Uncharacterized protein n=1 Tax=Favolaschia claudopus TaxID=2862362 RepID=A0AAW0C8S4_9AGAR